MPIGRMQLPRELRSNGGILDSWARHAMASETMDALGVGSHQLKGYDFAQNFPGAVPGGVYTPTSFLGPMLAKGYQYGQELGNSILDGPGGYTMGQAIKNARRQSDENIQGMRGQNVDTNMYNDFISRYGLDNVRSNIGSAQASIPTQDDMIKAGIAQQMIKEGTATPMARRTYGDMSMGQGRPDWVADRNRGITEIDIAMAPQIKEAIYRDRIMNPNLPRFVSQPQYRIRDQLKRDFLEGGLFRDARQSLGQTKDALLEDFQGVGQGLGSFKDKIANMATGFYDSVSGGIKNIMDNTIVGRIAAGFDARNPRAFNYNPALQGQIDYLKGQNQYGVMDQSGLNKITSGVLAGKNLQSMFGSNDLNTMYEKELARATKVLDNLPNQWSRLKEEDPEEYARKEAFFRDKVNKIKTEQAAAAAATKKIKTGGEGGGGKKIITRKTGDGGGGKSYTTGATAGKTGSWTPGGTYSGGYQQSKGSHHYSQGGIVSLWRR